MLLNNCLKYQIKIKHTIFMPENFGKSGGKYRQNQYINMQACLPRIILSTIFIYRYSIFCCNKMKLIIISIGNYLVRLIKSLML